MDVDAIFPYVLPIAFFVLPAAVVLFTLSRRAARKDRVRAAAVKLGLSFSDAGDAFTAMLGGDVPAGTEAPSRADLDQLRKMSKSTIGQKMIRLVKALGPWTMEGQFEGAGVRAYTESRGGSKNRRTYTCLRASYAQQRNWGLGIAREGWMDRLSRGFGGQDLQLQPDDRHAEFNKLVRIRANVEAETQIQRVFGAPEVQAAVRKLLEDVPDAFLDDSGAGVDVSSVVSDETEFRRYFAALTSVVRAVEGMQ